MPLTYRDRGSCSTQLEIAFGESVMRRAWPLGLEELCPTGFGENSWGVKRHDGRQAG